MNNPIPKVRGAFAAELAAIDGGRFATIIDALPGVCDSCRKCDFFNPGINDKTKGYRCHVAGSCPAATLHPNLQSYIWARLSND